MKKSNYGLIATGILMLFFSCKKTEIDDPILDDPIEINPADIADNPEGIDTYALSSFFTDNIAEATQHFTTSAESFIYITGEKGTILLLNSNQLVDSDGNLVTGLVDIELIEIDKKSEIIMLNKATTGINQYGQHETLISDGEFYVSISQNGEELTTLSPMMLYSFLAPYDPDMRKFVNTSEEEDLLWEMAEDSLLNEDGEFEGTGAFEILPGEWGWTNIDKFYNDPSPQTEIYAELPEGFNNTNTEVFISYDGESNALAQFDVWEDGRFTEHYGLIPIGLDVHFIAVRMIGGELNYSIQGATIIEDHVQLINDFMPINEDDLVDLIDELP